MSTTGEVNKCFHKRSYHSYEVWSFQDTNDGAKFAASLLGTTKAASKLKKSTKGKVPKSCRKNNMDLAKALGIMGFTSTRWSEKHKGNNPKEELDKAQFAKLMQIQKKKVSYQNTF